LFLEVKSEGAFCNMRGIQRNINSNQSRINALLIVLRISFAFYILKLVFELFRYSLWMKVWRGVPISLRQAQLVEIIEMLSWAFQGVLFLLCGIYMILWMHRSYSNLGQFQQLRFDPVWAAIGWFVPVFSYFGPFMIYTSLVKGYEELLASQNYIRRNPRRHALKNWWWISWIVGVILLGLSFGYERYNLFCSAIASAVLMLSNLLLISSLSDMKMMEEGIGELKDINSLSIGSEDLLDDIC